MNTCSQVGRKSTLHVREMSVDDIAAVFHIGEIIFTAEYSPSLYRTWDEYEVTSMFNSDSELCLVAESEEQIVGFALGTTVEKRHSAWKYGYLVWLGVCPKAQQLRVGQNLFNMMKKRMRAQGVRMIIVDTAADNRPAIDFFDKLGFGNIQEHVYLTLNLGRKKKGTKKKKKRSNEPLV
ncbi:MAG: GNAT family N-acetyltransferase [Desulfurivibrio sp.]|nr:GNAT family N-acetyltransferase [Desulfurivibrio sp.]